MRKTGNSVKDRRDKSCNGWRNWDTWHTGVIIGNDRKAYDFVRKNKARLLSMKKKDKLAEIDRHSEYGLHRSGISYDNVDFRELNSFINDID